MINKTNHSRSKRQGVWAALLLASAFLLAQPDNALAQWVTNGNNINNTNTGNVGIGTTTPAAKLEVVGHAMFGGNAQLKTSNPAFYMFDTSGTPDQRQFYFWNASDRVMGRWANDANSAVVAESVTFRNNGFMGIGTISPNYKVEVQGSSSRNTFALFGDGDAAGYAGIKIGALTTAGIATNRTSEFNIHMRKDSWYGGDGSGPSFIIETNSKVGGFAAPFLITPTNDVILNGGAGASGLSYGNVGIGTTTPGSKLEVIGNIALSDSSRVHAKSDFGNYLMPYTSFGRMAFGTQGFDRMSILYNGNVGIGTQAPSDKLEISGGSLYMNGENTGVVVDAGGLRRIAFMKYPGREAGIWRVSGQDFEIGRVNPQVSALPGNPTAFTTDMYIAGSGDIGVGTTTPTAKLHVVGDVTASGTITAGNIVARYQDIAEWVPSRKAMPAGTVVVLDTVQLHHVLASSQAYDTQVAGVVSERPGLILGEGGDGKLMVATTGRVRVKVDATRAPIRVGDILVTSDREGLAMRSEPIDVGGAKLHRPGTIIGKALEPLDTGIGEILVLLSLQ